MFRRQTIPVVLATVISLGSATHVAYAGVELNDKEEMTANLNAKIFLAQAEVDPILWTVVRLG